MDFFIGDSSVYTIDIIGRAITFDKGESDIIKGSVIKEVLKGGLTGGYLSTVCRKSKLVICFSEGSKGNQGVMSVVMSFVTREPRSGV